MDILIKNGYVIDPSTGVNAKLDILVKNGVIEKIAPALECSPDVRVIDAAGLVVAPGLIDMHCHLREPGFEESETIYTGARAAAAGGYTSVACMPNTKPVADCEDVIKQIKDTGKAVGSANIYPIGAVTKAQAGLELTDFAALKAAGAVALSDDGRPIANAAIMRKALELAAELDMPLISHCEEPALSSGVCINEGETAKALNLSGIPAAAEEIMIARDILLARSIGAAVHIAHVSTAGGVAIIREAKRRGVKVTAETCPHYFALTEKAVAKYGTNAKMNPPLRTEDDVRAVIEGLCDGTIDVIATDHAPHTAKDKAKDFALAPNGIVGLETSLGLALTCLVHTGKMSLADLIYKYTAAPAKILRLDRGTLAAGKPADITIIDPNRRWRVDVSKLYSKSKNSPFDGFELTGKAAYTIVQGKIVMDREKLI